MKVTGEYMGKRDEMTLEVAQREQNRRLVTRQTEGPFQKWESTQEFQSSVKQLDPSQSYHKL